MQYKPQSYRIGYRSKKHHKNDLLESYWGRDQRGFRGQAPQSDNRQIRVNRIPLPLTNQRR